jgi:hypothetical protein
MNLEKVMEQLERTPELIENLCLGLSEEEAHWKPSDNSWSVVEVINHLYDEEREDFRRRVNLTLNYPGMPWPPITPEEWAVDRSYNKMVFTKSLHAFADERQKSLEFLKNLEHPDWDKYYDHPQAGKIHAGDLILSWAAHDLLHIRQIAMLRAQLIGKLSEKFNISYASPLTLP